MFRLDGRIVKKNNFLNTFQYEEDSFDTRTHKVFKGLNQICETFDLEHPIWLDENISDFKRLRRTRFHQDNFIEQIEFDYLEIEIIEE